MKKSDVNRVVKNLRLNNNIQMFCDKDAYYITNGWFVFMTKNKETFDAIIDKNNSYKEHKTPVVNDNLGNIAENYMIRNRWYTPVRTQIKINTANVEMIEIETKAEKKIYINSNFPVRDSTSDLYYTDEKYAPVMECGNGYSMLIMPINRPVIKGE